MGFFRRKAKKSTNDRRVRTQQEEPSQRVISYYTASRRQLDNFERTSPQNESLAYRRFERIRSAWFTIIVAIVIIFVLAYMGTLATKPQIIIQGTQYRSAGEIEAAINSAFGQDIRNRVKPFLQSRSLEEHISQAVPEAKAVLVTSTLLGHRPEVTIVTDEPIAIFSQPGGTDYLISSRGRLLLPVSAATSYDTVKLPIVQNQTGVSGKAGEQFMRPDEAQALRRLYAQYNAESSKPIFTLSVVPHELLVKESGRGSYQAKYLLDDTIVNQFGSLRATEKKLSELGQTPVEYIDVRLVDKVYYK